MNVQRLRIGKAFGMAMMAVGFVALSPLLPAQQEAPKQPVVTNRAEIVTSMGTVEIELYGEDAPRTVKNFLGLAAKGFYNGLLIHRVIPGFIIQTGDPQTRDTMLRARWGRGGESIYGGEFEDELNRQAPSYKRGYVEGTLAMANRGANTNTSQFFIMLADDTLQTGDTTKKARKPLPMSYTIFGRVTAGMDVLRNIAQVELSKSYPEMPATPVTLIEVREIDPKLTGQ